MNKGHFKPGPDRRRHRFSKDECSRGGRSPTSYKLTRADRVKGGLATWARTMAETRLAMGLPLPTSAVREAARKLAEERRKRRAS